MLQNSIFLITFQIFLTFVLIKLSYSVKLLDYPNKRKLHKNATPLIGGISISVVYVTIVFTTNFEYELLNYIFSYSLIISLLGLLDDKYHCKPLEKLILQSIPIFILISKGLYLTDIGNYNFFGKINLGSYSEIFTFFCCLLIVNAFNYTDGVDGLLSSLFVNIILTFSLYCLILNEFQMAKHLLYFVIPVFIFIFFNLSIFNLPKIFLGDSGSLMLGYIVGFLMIFLYIKLKIPVTLLIWPIALILFDFLSTNLIRIIKKKKVFAPSNDHLHNQLMKKLNLSKIKLNIAVNLMTTFFTLFGYMIFYFFNPLFSIIFYVLSFIFFIKIKLRYLY